MSRSTDPIIRIKVHGKLAAGRFIVAPCNAPITDSQSIQYYDKTIETREGVNIKRYCLETRMAVHSPFPSHHFVIDNGVDSRQMMTVAHDFTPRKRTIDVMTKVVTVDKEGKSEKIEEKLMPTVVEEQDYLYLQLIIFEKVNEPEFVGHVELSPDGEYDYAVSTRGKKRNIQEVNKYYNLLDCTVHYGNLRLFCPVATKNAISYVMKA